MPGYVIHLAEASLALKRIRKNPLVEDKISTNWIQLFYYGALLPDSLGGTEKKISHFWNDEDASKVMIGPDIQRFQKKYKDELQNFINHPLLFGYYHHLYTDWDFFTNFMYKVVQFLDEKDNPTTYLRDVQKVRILKNNKIIKLEELFSEDYLYGDYTLLNKVLIQNLHLTIPIYDEKDINKIDVSEIKNGDMSKVIQKLEFYISESEKKQGKLQVFEDGIIEEYLRKCSDAAVNVFQSIGDSQL